MGQEGKGREIGATWSKRNIWIRGCRKRQEMAVLLFLCPCSLKLMEMKGYVGGLGASASNSQHIGSLGNDRKIATDDESDSFTSLWVTLLR